MFLNKTMFKKWIKNAFNHGGLTVGYLYDGLVIAGNPWVVWIREDDIPNWVKAAVMEYTGELPKYGCVFKAEKDSAIQYEISENEYFNLPERFMEAKTPFTVTPVIYAANWNHYRKNDSSALAICSSKLGDDGNRVLEALERIDFRKEDK